MFTPLQIREAFGSAAPPTVIWEEQFDWYDEELAEIGKKEWQLVTERDLWFYFHDLCYMELQPDLFAHLFPVCLNFWFDTLMRDEGTERGDSDFHRSLLRGQILQKMVTPEQREFVYQFFHDGFLERLKTERGFADTGGSNPAYGWMTRFNSLGLVVPLTERIWKSWWNFDHPGKAVCAIKWASGLVFKQGENPIFEANLMEVGGGGPYLLQTDTDIYDSVWLPENWQFLQTTLTEGYLQARLIEAAETLRGEPEHEMALFIASQARDRSETIESRTAVLLRGLNTVSLEQIRML